jgi:hypothetical protein
MTDKNTSKFIYLVLDATQVIFTVIVFINFLDSTFAYLVPILSFLMFFLSLYRSFTILYFFTHRVKLAKRREEMIYNAQ